MHRSTSSIVAKDQIQADLLSNIELLEASLIHFRDHYESRYVFAKESKGSEIAKSLTIGSLEDKIAEISEKQKQAGIISDLMNKIYQTEIDQEIDQKETRHLPETKKLKKEMDKISKQIKELIYEANILRKAKDLKDEIARMRKEMESICQSLSLGKISNQFNEATKALDTIQNLPRNVEICIKLVKRVKTEVQTFSPIPQQILDKKAEFKKREEKFARALLKHEAKLAEERKRKAEEESEHKAKLAEEIQLKADEAFRVQQSKAFQQARQSRIAKGIATHPLRTGQQRDSQRPYHLPHGMKQHSTVVMGDGPDANSRPDASSREESTDRLSALPRILPEQKGSAQASVSYSKSSADLPKLSEQTKQPGHKRNPSPAVHRRQPSYAQSTMSWKSRVDQPTSEQNPDKLPPLRVPGRRQ